MFNGIAISLIFFLSCSKLEATQPICLANKKKKQLRFEINFYITPYSLGFGAEMK